MSVKKVAVVTGAANGIGEAAARLFARRGYAAAIMDINEKIYEVRDDITAVGGQCIAKQCDTSKEKDVEEFIAHVMKTYGRIDALNNNAGIVIVKPLEETTWEDYRRVVDVNLGGIFLFCKHVLPVMKNQKGGAVVNMGSVSGHVGQTDHAIYGATKGAIIAFSRSLAREFGSYGLNINVVCPGLIQTPMGAATGQAGIEGYTKKSALKRIGQPEEVAAVIAFLASDAAGYVTGQAWNVCGGTRLD